MTKLSEHTLRGVLAAALMGAPAVMVGSMPAPARAQAAATISFDIPAQPLIPALVAFSDRSGLQLFFDSSLARDLKSPGASGTMTAETALRRLLSGTGMTYRFTNAGTVTLERVAANGAMTLDPVTVEGGAGTLAEESATGPVQGYVAKRSASGTKTDTPLVETPQSISVVSAEQIADRGVSTVEDAVAYVAGVRVGGSGMDLRYDQMSIRGFSATSNSDYLDGLRQPNSGWLSYYGTEPYGLERVEVVKGPASVLYGQIGPGGLVNRVSKRPQEQAIHEVEMQAGNNGLYQGQFDMGDRLTKDGTLLYRVVGLSREAGTDIDQINNDTRFIAPSLTWKPGLDTQITLLTQYQDKLTGGSQRPYQRGSTLTDFWAGDEDFDKLDQTQYTAGYSAEHKVNEVLTLRQNLRYGYVDTTNQYLSSGTLTAGHILSRTAYGVYENMRSLAVDNQAAWRFATGSASHTVLSGVDYMWRLSNLLYTYGTAPSIDMWAPNYHQTISRPGTVASNQTNTANIMGFYLQDQIEIGQWRLTGGLRQDVAKTSSLNRLTQLTTKNDDDALTGRVGLLYLFPSGIAPYTSFSTSFLPTSGTDLYGTPYKPTEGTQYEVGLKYQPPGHNSTITAALYDLTQSNVKTIDPANVSNSVQTGEQRSRGLELEGVAEMWDGLKLTASYTVMKAEITRSNDGNQGKKPVNTPEQLAALWADYTLPAGPLEGLGFGAGARWTGPSFNDAANTLRNSDYTLVDSAVHYDLGGQFRGARLALNVNNLADERYLVCESTYCYRGQGRSVVGSVRYRW